MNCRGNTPVKYLRYFRMRVKVLSYIRFCCCETTCKVLCRRFSVTHLLQQLPRSWSLVCGGSQCVSPGLVWTPHPHPPALCSLTKAVSCSVRRGGAPLHAERGQQLNLLHSRLHTLSPSSNSHSFI